jgi:Hint domain
MPGHDDRAGQRLDSDVNHWTLLPSVATVTRFGTARGVDITLRWATVGDNGMADVTGFITFTNVSMNAVGGGIGAFSHATLDINYTTLTATLDPSSPPLTFDGHTFTSFVLLEPSPGAYTLVSENGTFPNINAFEVSWEGHSPFEFLSFPPAAAIVGGKTFEGLHHNTITPAVCFAAGTRIRTPRGDVLVETLETGDLVLTASGDMRPVKWMGHRDVDFRRTPNASPGQPIRIAADTFGPARPSQDLYISAGHSVCVDLLGEVFIPVGYLANGATIAAVEVEEISYWHVELDSHDVLVANNLPAESYLAMGNRSGFEELRGLLPAVMEGRERTHADFCRPVVTEGPVLAFVRQRLLARAAEMGWKLSVGADLHLVADGGVIRPRADGSLATFEFPASAKDVRLMSNVFSPSAVGSHDPRMLGVMLCDEIAIGGRKVSLGDERLRDGVHELEDHDGKARRWTNGELVLDPQLWEGQPGLVSLVVNYDVTTVRGWTAPATERKTAPVGPPKLRAVG